MYFDLKIRLGLVLFRIDVGFFVFWACSVTILFFFFFFKDFSSKFFCHKNVESVPNFAEGAPLFINLFIFYG